MNKPKDAKKPQESKFSKAKPLIVIGGIVIATVSFIALGVVKAVDNLNNEAKVEGSRTQGQANVEVKKVVEDSVDGTIKVPDASPIAQQTREREERERQEAQARGESHITQTRVVGEDSQNEYSGKPKSQEVDSLGQEVDESIEQNKRTTALNSDTKSNKSAEEVVLPLNEDKKELDSKQSQIEDLRKQLAASEAGRLAKDKAVNNGEAERQAAQLEAQRKAVRAERILNGAKSLFGGLAYAPPSGSQYTVEYNAGADVYASTSSNMFSPNDAKQPAASALYRNDGGITQPGVHPYFTKRAEEQVQQQKLTAVNSSKVESGDTEVDPERIVFNSGEIVYARTTLPIDSDIPGPIRIRMLTGKAKGAIGFGSISLVEQASGVALKLDSVILNGKPIQAKAWALSPETELALFDEHVDHHYIQRFGGLFAGLFMTGFLDSLIETTVTNGNGSTTTTTGGIEGTKERIVYSLASAAQGFLPILYDAASRPIQVKIPKGTPMYLLFEEQVLDTDLIERKSQSELLQEMVNEPKAQESESTQSKVDITPQTTRATNNPSNGASVNLAIETDGQKIKLWE